MELAAKPPSPSPWLRSRRPWLAKHTKRQDESLRLQGCFSARPFRNGCFPLKNVSGAAPMRSAAAPPFLPVLLPLLAHRLQVLQLGFPLATSGTVWILANPNRQHSLEQSLFPRARAMECPDSSDAWQRAATHLHGELRRQLILPRRLLSSQIRGNNSVAAAQPPLRFFPCSTRPRPMGPGPPSRDARLSDRGWAHSFTLPPDERQPASTGWGLGVREGGVSGLGRVGVEDEPSWMRTVPLLSLNERRRPSPPATIQPRSNHDTPLPLRHAARPLHHCINFNLIG